MPLYTFKCSKCGIEFEDILSINDRNRYVGSGCGNCNSKSSVIRLPDSGSFIINGYCEATGYATKRRHT